MSYWVPDPNSARATRAAQRAMSEVPEQPGAAADPSTSGVQAAEVAAASQLLSSLGIAVGPTGGAARPTPERPSNLGLKLPVFKGEPDRSGRVSQYAVQDFLDRVDAYFASNAGQYASESMKLLSLLNCFPYGSPSAVWWASLKGTCFTLEEFRTAFRTKYGFDERDAHYLMEKFSNFKQRDTDNVVAYHTHFTQLVTEMTLLLKPEDVPSAATQRARFINGLQSALKTLVLRTVTRHPNLSLYEVMQEAIMEERQLPRRPRPTPKINTMQTKPRRNRKRAGACGFCDSTDHDWDSCPIIAAKKRAGTWKEQPRAPGQQ